MPKVSPIQGNFNSGEVSPLFFGRSENPRYKSGLETCLRFLPTMQGGLTRMPGTKYVAEVKTSSKTTRLIPFEFSTTQAYILEFGDQYIRFYRNNGQITSGGSAYEISSPYLEADLFDLQVTQSANVLYIVHPDYAPRILTRADHDDWGLTELEFLDGPYLSKQTTDTDINGYIGPDAGGESIELTPAATTGTGINLDATSTTLSVSGAADNGSGLIRITVGTMNAVTWKTGAKVYITGITGTTEANGTWTMTRVTDTTFDLQGSSFTNTYSSGGTVYPQVFQSGDVGRLIRIDHSGNRGWAEIASYVNPTRVTVDIEQDFNSTNSTADWFMGVYSESSGYPATITFFEDRLCLAGATETPQRIDLSYSSEYTNFSTADSTGTVIDSNAIAVSLNANDVNAIRWLASDEKGLLVGTTGGEWVVRSNASYDAVTPTNISAKQSTAFGSSLIQPIKIGKATIYTQRAKKKIREFTYFFEVDGFKSNDITILSNHITGTGITQMAYQKEPIPLIWAVRSDGVLIGCTYERDLDNIRAGWHRHIMGGVSDAAGSDAKVESIAVIPSTDNSTYELWMVIERYINGGTKRYVEYLTPVFDENTDQEDAFFVDSGLTYDVPVDISGITKADPGVVTTSSSHGFSDGDKVVFRKIKGMTELNNVTALVANKTATTFELTDLSGNNIDTTSYATYVSSGEVRKLVTTLSGLDHLEGESVSILADGAVQPDATVSSGSVTLAQSAATVHIGLGYNSDAKLLRLDAGAADGTSIGKTRRIHNFSVMLYRSLGLDYGFDFDDLDTYTFRTSADPMTRAPSLFTGIIKLEPQSNYDKENQICLRQSQPLPLTILAVMPQMITQDRG